MRTTVLINRVLGEQSIEALIADIERITFAKVVGYTIAGEIVTLELEYEAYTLEDETEADDGEGWPDAEFWDEYSQSKDDEEYG